MKRAYYLVLLALVFLLAAVAFFVVYEQNVRQARVAPVTIDVPALSPSVSRQQEAPALNLALPRQAMLQDPMPLPEKKHQLEQLFESEEKEDTVKIGGGLILDDKPQEPNAAVWDTVKGAEVGITIKTP